MAADQSPALTGRKALWASTNFGVVFQAPRINKN
jgi:hypothetical protein